MKSLTSIEVGPWTNIKVQTKNLRLTFRKLKRLVNMAILSELDTRKFLRSESRNKNPKTPSKVNPDRRLLPRPRMWTRSAQGIWRPMYCHPRLRYLLRVKMVVWNVSWWSKSVSPTIKRRRKNSRFQLMPLWKLWLLAKVKTPSWSTSLRKIAFQS